MSGWNAAEWGVFFMGLAQALAWLWGAVHVGKKLDEHDAAQAARHSETLTAIGSRGLNP